MIAWEKTGASAGICAALSLGIGYAITHSTSAALGGTDADYVRALLAERMKWELVTLVRLLGGMLVLWFAATLADRLRLAEGDPGRLAETAFGLGVLWAGIWLFSAFFNSASILFAADYSDPAGSRIAGVLATEIPYVLTPSIVFTLLLATSLVTLRSWGIPRSYAYVTGALTVVVFVLAVIDWWGPGTLGPWIVTLALLWMATTGVVLLSGSKTVRLSGRVR